MSHKTPNYLKFRGRLPPASPIKCHKKIEFSMKELGLNSSQIRELKKCISKKPKTSWFKFKYILYVACIIVAIACLYKNLN